MTHQIMEKRREYIGLIHQLFGVCRFQESLLFSQREVLYSILIEFGIPVKLVTLIRYV
jgi:hypothetical protein